MRRDVSNFSPSRVFFRHTLRRMKLLPILATLTFTSSLFGADPLSVVYEGAAGPGKGKHIVLLAGDEEYRSEEAMPMLGKLLSQRHGFKCTVIFSVNANTGDIDPNTNNNQPGIEALGSADLCITSLRFRKWSDEHAKPFVDYYNAGKPFIGLRTSTHAFNGMKGDYAWLNKFGKDVLGEQWVSHWGRHKAEATRGVVEKGAEGNPLLRGAEGVFGLTDVYEAYPPADATILMRGIVLKGMKPESEPADYKKKRATDKAEQGVNDPAMPIVWTREHKQAGGKVNKVFCTTMGDAVDLANEGLRRIIVNAAYQFTGLEVPAKADVTVVGEYKPTMYGFGGFKKGVKPADHALTK